MAGKKVKLGTIHPRLAEQRRLKTERIDQIVSEMLRGAYPKSRSPELAQQWGMPLATVQDYSADASRIVKHLLANDEDTRVTFDARMDAAYESARIACDNRACVALLALMAKVRGYEAAEKIEHRHVDAKVVFADVLENPAEMTRLLTKAPGPQPDDGFGKSN